MFTVISRPELYYAYRVNEVVGAFSPGNKKTMHYKTFEN